MNEYIVARRNIETQELAMEETRFQTQQEAEQYALGKANTHEGVEYMVLKFLVSYKLVVKEGGTPGA